MGAIDNIYKTLSKLKIYNLKGKYINAELSAYKIGFEYIENKINETLKGAFVFLAEDSQLKNFERLLLLPSTKNATIENRREMICSRLGINKNDYTIQGITKAIRSIGFDAKVIEVCENGKIKILNKGFLKEYDSLDAIKNAMIKVLPAHLDFELDIGVLTWNMLEEKDLSCIEFENNNFNWEQIDLNGHNLKGGI